MSPVEIYTLRTAMRLTQADFGRLFGVHAMTVSKWERNLLTPTPYQQALMHSFRAAVERNKAKVQQVQQLLIGAGVVAALLLLLSTAKE